jgi:hypothetical protein
MLLDLVIRLMDEILIEAGLTNCSTPYYMVIYELQG